MDDRHYLSELGKLCEYIEEMEPSRRALTNDSLILGIRKGRFLYMPMDITKPIRDGVIFYSSGWGWRLRRDWQIAIESKLANLPH